MVILSAILGVLLLLPASAMAQSSVESYDLGEVTIVQQSAPADSRFREMPVALRGVLGVPDGDGPFAVGLFFDGSYPCCSAPIPVDVGVGIYPCPREGDLRQYGGVG